MVVGTFFQHSIFIWLFSSFPQDPFDSALLPSILSIWLFYLTSFHLATGQSALC